MLELELEGALRIRGATPARDDLHRRPALEELERRLRERATESAGEIDEPHRHRAREQRERGEFDHVVVNDDVERAASELDGIVDRELARPLPSRR